MALAAASSWPPASKPDLDTGSATCTVQVQPAKRLNQVPGQAESSQRPGELKKSRAKYTQQACDSCRQRKVKCCGKSPCWRCAVKDATCTYGCDRPSPSIPAARPQRNSSMTQHLRETALAFEFEQDAHATLVQSLDKEPRVSEQPPRRPSEGLQAPSEGGQTDSLPRTQIPYRHLYQSPSDPDEETDTFEINNCGESNMSLRSKLSVLHDTLAIDFPTPVPTPQPSETYPGQSPIHDVATQSLVLPQPQTMLYLLQVYFEEHNPFFPCLDRSRFESRVLQWVSSEGYGARSRKIAIPASQTSLAALLCMVFALADFIDPQRAWVEGDINSTTQTPGNAWYRKGVALLREVRHIRRHYLDVIAFHTIEAMYLIDVEQLGVAEKAVAMAMSLTIRGGLNNESSWTGCTERERLSRRMLWWSLYYIDRRVAEKSGRPYCMRDIEVNVDDFSTLSATDERSPLSPDARSQLHLQAVISWARLWGQAWDTFFALKAPHLGDQSEVEAMDARIEAMRRDLPAVLKWDTASFDSYINAGQDQRMIRYRLLTMTRINLLRMILRHNPLTNRSSDPRTTRLCGSIAIETIDAIVLYMDRYHCIGQLGHFAAATLVECICHLIPSLATRVPQSHREAATAAFNRARQLLLRLSTHRGAAKRAQKVMEHIFDAVSRLPMGQGSEVFHSDAVAGTVAYRVSTPPAPETTAPPPAYMTTMATATTTILPSELVGNRNQTELAFPDPGGSRKRKAEDNLEQLDPPYSSTTIATPSLDWDDAGFPNDWLLNSCWMDLSSLADYNMNVDLS